MGRKSSKQKQIRQVAQEHFGFEALSSGQEAAIQSLLEGHDTLAVMPTGAGKSAIYQIAGLLMPGPTVIVSPLVALQADQVESIEDQDLAEAAVLNSTLSTTERQEVLEALKEEELEFLFLAPEQFNNEDIRDRLQSAKPSLFVIDEAHCVSEWGHDFRPDYLRLGSIIESLDHPRVLALTATASPLIREEIVEHLHMNDPQVVVRGFDRPNIWLGVERFEEETDQKSALVERVSKSKKPGIVYVATRKQTEEIAQALSDRDQKAAFYHAGMKSKDREQVQTAFMEDGIEVIVATTAFGMGIDKPNVRFVFHYNISDSVDAYYQEIGRAGRDGEPAQAVLFYNPKDLNLRRFFASGCQVDEQQVEQVARVIQKQKDPMNLQELQEETDLSKAKLSTVISRLEEVGVVDILPGGEVELEAQEVDLERISEEVVQAQERYQQFERSRLEMMRGYAEVRDCRREYILNYFGEQLQAPCDYCDNCKAGATVDDGVQPFPIDSRVTHKTWGEGSVMRYEGDKVVVLFDEVGYKTLGTVMALVEGILRKVH